MVPDNLSEEEAARKRPSIAFGVERLGLLALKAPLLWTVVLLALCVGAVFGLERIGPIRSNTVSTRP